MRLVDIVLVRQVDLLILVSSETVHHFLLGAFVLQFVDGHFGLVIEWEAVTVRIS